MIRNPWFLITALFPLLPLTAAANPEQDSKRIAEGLRSFSDSDWLRIAGDKSTERYEVMQGDTLWAISGRLFGDEKVWPKIWEINNTGILNPHMIEPKMALFFSSGSGLDLPTLAVSKTGISTVKNHYRVDPNDRPGPTWDDRTPVPSSEWKRLPRQNWENVQVDLPADIDKDGFDTKNRVYLRKPATGIELPALVACAPITPVGRVEGARSDATSSNRGNEITVRANGKPLEVGALYSVLDPTPMKIQSEGREALSYEVAGKVKILGVQSGVYVAEVIRTQSPLERGSLLIPVLGRIDKIPPVAGSAKVSGSIISDRRTGAFMSGQNKWVYIDRGTRDGVEPGMLFRIFQNVDPRTGKQLTPGEVFVQGDAQITQNCENFSIGTFIWTRGEVPERYPGVLLTDISDEKIRFYFNGEAAEVEMTDRPIEPAPSVIVDAPLPEAPAAPEALLDAPGDPEVLTPTIEPRMEGGLDQADGDGEDWLDRLDDNQELRSEEENELLQLEKFQEQTAEAPSADPTAPAESELPPAPEEALPPPPDELTDLPPSPEGEPAFEAEPPSQSATAPTESPDAPADEDSVEGLPPL